MEGIRESGEHGSRRTAPPAKAQAREDDRQVVQVLENIMPMQHGQWCNQMEEADQKDPSHHSKNTPSACAVLLHKRFALVVQSSIASVSTGVVAGQEASGTSACAVELWHRECKAYTVSNRMEVVQMKTKMTCIAILLAFGLLTVAANADQNYRITLNAASKIGNAELQPGEYKVAVDAPKVVLTELKTGKSVELEAKIENMDEKFDRTEVHSNVVDGVNRINEIRIGGSKTKLAFNN